MRLLVLVLLLAPMAFGASVCPPGGASQTGLQAGVLTWRSYAGEIGKEKHCVGNEVRNASVAPLAVSWPEAGIAQAWVRDRIEVALCCFRAEETQRATLRYGTPERALPVTMHRESEKGGEEDDYPDLIEADARERIAAIRGTLWAGSQPVRVDLLLKCSASRFANQYAYQFSITNRSEDPVEVDWDLLRNLRGKITPSVQPIPQGAAYLFLSAQHPDTAEGVVEVKTKSGKLAGRFHVGGFAPGLKEE